VARTIYFSGSISGGRADLPMYRRIVDALEAAGHRVLAGSVTANHIGDEGDPLDAEAIFERDLRWIGEVARANGILVAEVSLPSTGVGYEIATARYRYNMPVICLYRPAHTRRCTAMVAGDAGIRLIDYSDESVEAMLERLRRALGE
jgi:NAD(P)-dependent dehydrogenase (short-subunit alcohol dehydrogenase family)